MRTASMKQNKNTRKVNQSKTGIITKTNKIDQFFGKTIGDKKSKITENQFQELNV